MKKTTATLLPIVVILLVAGLSLANRDSSAIPYKTSSGLVFGTSYNITYQSNDNFDKQINLVLDSVDMSLSPFNKQSIITAVNENRPVQVDKYFTEVFRISKEVYQATDGAFDITVAPLVNVWGFGFKEGHFPTNHEVDSLRAIVGFNKVRLEGQSVIKDDPRIMLDCSAVAKGYAVDKIAEMFTRNGIQNYLVEVGGEIVARGQNSKGKAWNIGVVKPEDDSLSINSSMQMIVSLTDCALATSGNYRNYYIRNGRKYAHTINPKTGRPSESNMLSATIVTTTCAKADAYATAFMTMGQERAMNLLKKRNDMKYILIYDDNGKTRQSISEDLYIK